LNSNLIQLVDEDGNSIGKMEKIAAHANGGMWHRAISVFLFDDNGRLLIQQRASGKYHFAGLWANSCCSHPHVDETVEQAAKRTMLRELGLVAEVEEVHVVRYEAHDPISGNTEMEHDHILVGKISTNPIPNPEEVQDYRWLTIDELNSEIEKQPESFAPWLPIILSSGAFTR
jgi:isopentenyl-diphosphate delta-isomerase